MNDLESLPALSSADLPRATYRLQFHAGFRLADATALVPYLSALGISHLYASSYLKARKGSQHGYDIVDHNALNPEIGDEADHDRLCAALESAGMKQLLDVVPNHMGVLARDNAWWTDVVENGPSSRWSRYFDIDWSPQAPSTRPRQLLLAILGEQYGQALEAGKLELRFDPKTGELCIAYGEERIPLDPSTYPDVLAADALDAVAELGLRRELAELREAFGRLPPNDVQAAAEKQARAEAASGLKETLARLANAHRPARDWIDESVSRFKGVYDDPSSFDALANIVEQQPWRLAYWRVAAHEVNYRRFFEVSSLAAVRMEDREVFDATHRTVLGWLRAGKVHALRIDHPDGLAEPGVYFERLQQEYSRSHPKALYLAVEKILADHEHWPQEWQVHGDTGYRFSNLLNGVFVDTSARSAFDALYLDFVGRRIDYDAELLASKRYVISKLLASDRHTLVEMAYQIALGSRRSRDLTRTGLRDAITELAAGMPVYRTYIGEGGLHASDRVHVEWAARNARKNGALDETDTLDFVAGLLLDDAPDASRLGFIHRFQQFTSPVMAKSMEDTAFYRYNRLVSLNDVGGDPNQFGVSVRAFHAANLARQRFMPSCMLAGSTHDSKRSEDVRARLNVLSEIAPAWHEAILHWRELRLRQVPAIDGASALEPNHELLLYQTLVGVLPGVALDEATLAELCGRLQAYMLKALREAKDRTSWLRPDEAYEAEVKRTIDSLLRALEPNPFLTDLVAFTNGLAVFGFANSLAQVTLKLTAPGVPDIYQGCESWNLSLVDPDNRRPVDFAQLQERLRSIQVDWESAHGLPRAMQEDMLRNLPDGRLKLLFTWRLLRLRAEHPEIFEGGSYVPLEVTGSVSDHVLAFARQSPDAETTCVTIVPRLLSSLVPSGAAGLDIPPGTWNGTYVAWLPGGAGVWQDVLTGRTVEISQQDAGTGVSVGALFETLPYAVLVRRTAAEGLGGAA